MISPMRGLILLAVGAGSLMSNFLFPVFFVFLPLVFRVIILSLLSVLFIWVNYGLFVGASRVVVVTGATSFFFGSMWFLPFLTTILFMPLTKIGEGLVKIADQG